MTAFTIRQQRVDVRLDKLAALIGAELRISAPVFMFRFMASTGDLIEDEESYIEFADGRRVPLAYDLLEAVVPKLCSGFVTRGFAVNDMVVGHWRDDPPLTPNSDSFFSIHLEDVATEVPSAPPDDLARALTGYFYDLPEDFNRATLNHLPHPSVWPKVVHRLLDEASYPHLIDVIRNIACNISEDIAVLICCEVVRADASAKGPSVQRDLAQTMPETPDHVKNWGANLLSLYCD